MHIGEFDTLQSCDFLCGLFTKTKAAEPRAQSNLYESVLKIPIVHADRVSKSLRQNVFFFCASAEKKYYISLQ